MNEQFFNEELIFRVFFMHADDFERMIKFLKDACRKKEV